MKRSDSSRLCHLASFALDRNSKFGGVIAFMKGIFGYPPDRIGKPRALTALMHEYRSRNTWLDPSSEIGIA